MNYMDRLTENCKVLDSLGYAYIRSYRVAPYEIDRTIKANSDCQKARSYYKRNGIKGLEGCHMHHTLDGYIVPVAIAMHRMDHHGGVKMHNLER